MEQGDSNARLLQAVKVDNDVAAARDALQEGADVDASLELELGRPVLYYAAFHGNREMLDLLLSYAPDVNRYGEDGFSALLEAIVLGHLDMAQKLIDAGADINIQNLNSNLSDGSTPLHAAFIADLADAEGKIERIKFMLDAGADEGRRDAQGQTVVDKARNHVHGPFGGETLDLLQAYINERAEKAQAKKAAIRNAVHGGTEHDTIVPKLTVRRRGPAP